VFLKIVLFYLRVLDTEATIFAPFLNVLFLICLTNKLVFVFLDTCVHLLYYDFASGNFSP